MKNRRNYYRLLQVQPDAPAEVIRASFRVLMKEMKQHPDLGGSAACAALLIEAYDTLMDPGRRAAYDREMFRRHPKVVSARQTAVKRSSATLFCPFCRHPLDREARAGERCTSCDSPLHAGGSDKAGRPPRRSIARMKREGMVRIHTEWPSRGQEARMVDLSPGGMRFVCPARIAPGAVLKITSPAFKAVGKVTNIREEEYGRGTVRVAGISFLAVEFEDPRGSFFDASG